VAKRLIAGLVALCLPGDLLAQRYSFKYYGQETGLSSLDILAMQQDRIGFLWVGTANGLYRYDGRRFRVYMKADGLPSMQVSALAETADGTLWAGSSYGLARLVGNRFEKIDIGKAKGTRSIATDSQHRLLVATDVGLVVGRPAADAPSGFTFRLYSSSGESPPAFGVASDSFGSIWYGCGKSICVLRNEVVSLADAGVPPDEYSGIAVDKHGNVWARSLTRLIELPKGSRRFLIQGEHLAPAVRIGRLHVDAVGDLLVPTARGLAYRAEAGQWGNVDKANGLPGSSVSFTTEDREGSLWVGVYGGGLVRWLGRRGWEAWTEMEGLSHDIVWAIQRDAEGTLWAGTECGLSRFDETTRRWMKWPTSPLLTGRVLTLLPTRDGNLWAGLSPGGVVELNPRSGRVVVHGSNHGLTNTEVTSLAADREGHIWAATRGGVFEGINEAGETRFRHVPLLPSDSLPLTSSVRCDRFGRLWITT
jgi:ligand-binding sensor domain-containing protein